MHPAFLDNMSWEMAEVYGAITDQILINLARHFPFYVAGETVPKSAFVYQAQMLAQMGQVNAETIRIIRNGLSDADLALKGVLEQSVIDAVRTAEPELLNGVKRGVFNLPVSIPVSPNQMRAFQLYYQQAADKLNLVNTVMLESTQSAYRQTVADVVSQIELADRMNRTQIALDVATGETVTGVSSWNAALKHATDRLKDGGIVGFVDHAGHQWSAESYVAMDIRTTVFNTGRAATWEVNQDFGNDLYLVSWHNGARPLCYPWQNKVISANNRSGVTYDLDGNEITIIPQSATSYGEAAGLFGINCKHYPTPFIPGVSVADGTPQDPEENKKTYEESQEQRRLERKLREEKRDLMMAKAQGAPQEELDRLREKCRNSSADIDEFCKKTGRARHRDREAVYTKREFPDKEKYDVGEFERKQKELIDDFYKNGGAQQGYTFGEMTPNEPIVQGTPATPVQPEMPTPQTNGFVPAKTREEAEAYAMEHFGNRYSSMSYKGIDLEYANTCNRVLTEVGEKYDVSALKGIQPMNLRTNMFKGTTAEAAYHWGGDGTLYINPTYYKSANAFMAHKKEIDELTKTVLEGGQALIDSGKVVGSQKLYVEVLLRTGRQCVSQSYDFFEASIVHESGHMLEDKIFRKVYDSIFGTTGIFEGSSKYLSESRMKYGTNISGYAIANNREYIAESFCAWWYGETGILDPALVKVFETAMKGM